MAHLLVPKRYDFLCFSVNSQNFYDSERYKKYIALSAKFNQHDLHGAVLVFFYAQQFVLLHHIQIKGRQECRHFR